LFLSRGFCIIGGMNNVRVWREILRRQRASGLPVAAFCRQTGVAVSSFYYWRRRVQAPASFTELKVLPPPTVSGAYQATTPSSGIELRLADGCCVIVQRGFDRQTLREVLQVCAPVEPPA
jgi:hypothetical protein